MTQQCTRGNNNYFRSPHFCILVLAVLATAPPAYPQRPPLAQPPPRPRAGATGKSQYPSTQLSQRYGSQYVPDTRQSRSERNIHRWTQHAFCL